MADNKMEQVAKLFNKKCGCHYYELSAEISEVDINKCNCDGGEGWECLAND